MPRGLRSAHNVSLKNKKTSISCKQQMFDCVLRRFMEENLKIQLLVEPVVEILSLGFSRKYEGR